ncbi:MAG: hypothetical protein ACW98Y_20860, partial [Candidatus Thorarchaeota archaeon]
MAGDFSISGVFSQKGKDGTPYDPVGKLAGFGGLIGLIAGVFGLVMGGGQPLIRLPLMEHAVFSSESYVLLSAIFVGLLSGGLLLQMIGARELRVKLASSFPNIGYLAAIVGFVLVGFALFGGYNTTNVTAFENYVVFGAALVSIFVILWQMYNTIFVDASKSWIGLFASILNGFFLPILAIGYVFGPIFIILAYVLLIVGQLFVWLFWWGPLDSIREYARSPELAKFGFGLTGLLTFLVGAVGVFANVTSTEWGLMWVPFSQNYGWNYVYVFAFTSALLFWVLQGPRLGKRELKAADISDDLVSGGIKYFAAFLAAIGIYGAMQSGTLYDAVAQAGSIYIDVSGTWAVALTWCTSGVLFLIGAIYVGRTDILTGLPIVIAAVMMSVHPMVIV